jgi:hypothetical protein
VKNCPEFNRISRLLLTRRVLFEYSVRAHRRMPQELMEILRRGNDISDFPDSKIIHGMGDRVSGELEPCLGAGSRAAGAVQARRLAAAASRPHGAQGLPACRPRGL